MESSGRNRGGCRVAAPDRAAHLSMRPIKQILDSVDRRLAFALSAYAILATIATIALDGILRTVMWAYFAFLTYKTIRAPRMDD